MAIVVQGKNDPCPKVIEARMSPPIFVDSRKTARSRESEGNTDKKSKYIYEWFPPEIFQKILVKRKKKEQE